MAKNFGKNDEDEYTAVDDLRHRGGAFVALGIICLIPPITAIGVVMIIFGGVQLLLSPVVQVNHDQMIAETERTGNGCGWFVITAIVGVVIILIAGASGWGAVLTMVDAGMVAP